MKKLLLLSLVCIFLLLNGCSDSNDDSSESPSTPAVISAEVLSIDALPKPVYVYDMAALPDNTLLVTGYYIGTLPSSTDQAVHDVGIVFKLTSTGALDPSFGTDGISAFRFETHTEPLNLAVNQDGSILVSGTVESWDSQASTQNTSAFLTRLTADGTIDTDFGINGLVTYSFTDFQTLPEAMGVQNDGKIILGCDLYGNPEMRYGLLRFNVDGSLDTSFATNGEYSSAPFDDSFSFHNLVVQADDAIIVGLKPFQYNGGQYLDPSQLIGFTPNGAVDVAFGSNGTVDLTDNLRFARILRTQSQRVIAIGTNAQMTLPTDPYPEIVLNAFDSLGNPDPTFGTQGISYVDIDNEKMRTIYDIEEDYDNRILFLMDLNYHEDAYLNWFGDGIQLVRLTENGVPDSLFGTNGIWEYDTTDLEQGTAMAILPNGTVFIGGTKGQADLEEETFLLRVTIQ